MVAVQHASDDERERGEGDEDDALEGRVLLGADDAPLLHLLLDQVVRDAVPERHQSGRAPGDAALRLLGCRHGGRAFRHVATLARDIGLCERSADLRSQLPEVARASATDTHQQTSRRASGQMEARSKSQSSASVGELSAGEVRTGRGASALPAFCGSECSDTRRTPQAVRESDLARVSSRKLPKQRRAPVRRRRRGSLGARRRGRCAVR